MLAPLKIIINFVCTADNGLCCIFINEYYQAVHIISSILLLLVEYSETCVLWTPWNQPNVSLMLTANLMQSL